LQAKRRKKYIFAASGLFQFSGFLLVFNAVGLVVAKRFLLRRFWIILFVKKVTRLLKSSGYFFQALSQHLTDRILYDVFKKRKWGKKKR
jgi:hypothetical protein